LSWLPFGKPEQSGLLCAQAGVTLNIAATKNMPAASEPLLAKKKHL
jgi:hypothetical protein